MRLTIVIHALLGAGFVAPTAMAASPAHPAGALCAEGGKFVNDDFSPTPAFAQQTRAPRPAPSSNYAVETVLSHVAFGRSMAFLPDGRGLIAERSGKVRMIGRDGDAGALIEGTPIAAKPSALIGLMDIVTDPNFASNGVLYLAYNTPKEIPTPVADGKAAESGKPPEGIGHIASARLSKNGERLENLQVIYEGALVRRMVVTGGTVFFSTVTAGGDSVQSLQHDAGKVLHIKTDGSPAPDNPFIERKDVGRFIYDLGHRDLDGLAQDGQGRLWSIEHGPRGGDELNLIQSGKNYGFTVIGYGREYWGAAINNGLTAKEGMEQPVYFWTPSIAPSGLMVYSGKMFPEWKGNIFVGALVAQSLVRLSLTGERVASEEFMLFDRCKRIRDVREAPDGSIYVLTDHEDGEVLRLSKK